MTPPILLTLGILVISIVLFISERLRMDLIALLVLCALALAGLVTADEALSGFSSGAVVVMWTMFILSAGLSRTGVAGRMGRWVLRVGGRGPVRILLVLMLAAAALSSVMNNLGVVALLLPVALDVARRTRQSPSRLLIPLSYATLMGGLITLIGTPPNLIANDALQSAGYAPLGMLEFAPLGLTITAAGILYFLVLGRHLLPQRDPARDLDHHSRLEETAFSLDERLFVVKLPPGSPLAGKTLAESHLGSALGVNVVGILRHGDDVTLAPEPHLRIQPGDRLLVSGRQDRLNELKRGAQLQVEEPQYVTEHLTGGDVQLAEVAIAPRSPMLGQTLGDLNFRRRFGANVLAIWRDGKPNRTNLQSLPLHEGDILLVQSTTGRLEGMRHVPDFYVSEARSTQIYRLDERLMLVRVPEDSSLAGKTLAESRLADGFGFSALTILRGDQTLPMPAPSEVLQPGDRVVVEARPEDLDAFRGLQGLEVDTSAVPSFAEMQSDQVGLVPVVLSPQSRLNGKTLRQVHFREKYGLSVLAIWRAGRPYRFNLRDMEIRFGDALLIYGPRARLKVLSAEPDFLVLSEEIKDAPRETKAPLAAGILLGMVALVVLGVLPVALAALLAATLMVLTGCLTMDEAYRAIDWRSVFLVAAMLPLGIAMQKSGAADWLAAGLGQAIAALGLHGQLAALFLTTALASQFIPSAVLVLLMAPLALVSAAQFGLPPQALALLVAAAASCNFITPVSHPGNVLVMGPGGYRMRDYLKVGMPLTLLLAVVTVFMVVWLYS
ncbi:MAG: SLC13 family permease [Anaerolineae bacterium]|nr:MAG: SLC13 family permease [Anaerolineae bacterium]